MLVLESSSTNSNSNSPPSTSSSTTNSNNLGITMLTNSSANQYLQPDYLSPLPTTLDSKRSPLALLAQTCSQIGADPTPPPSSTSTSSASKSSSEKSSNSKKSSNESSDKSSKTPPVSSASNKAYDYTRRTDADLSIGRQEELKSGFKSPVVGENNSKSTSATSPTSSVTTSSASSYAASYAALAADAAKLSEAQRAALEAMQSHKELPPHPLGAYRPSPMFPTLSGLSPYHHPGLAGLDAATAAALGAFRHPAYSTAHLGYPPSSLGLSLASYQQALSAASYGARMAKQQSDPICRDPYCTGCPSSMLAAAVAASTAAIMSASSTSPITTSSNGASCPAGCTQCDHMKTSSTTTTTTSSLISSATTAPTASSPTSRPYVCNWIAADHYCGKRFTTSEELLQHLRTHTSLSVPTSEASAYSPLLNPALHPHSHLLAASSALHRTYPTPPLSPLSMARYHPYSKPPVASQTSPLSQASPVPPPPNPLLSLHNPYAAYYSAHPYSLYSQRMLAGAGVLP